MAARDNSDAEVIRVFLKCPGSRSAFDAFFQLCFRVTLNYLRYKKPQFKSFSDQYSDFNHFCRDTAIDILGYHFESKPGRPFYLIIDYFRHRTNGDYDSIADEDLLDLFRVQLLRFIRQKISHFRAEEDPQIENLKRRFKDILRESYYHSLKIGDSPENICLESEQDNLRHDKLPVSFEALKGIAGEAFYNSKTRTEWCRLIFELLNKRTDLQNFVKKYEILTAVIGINSNFVSEVFGDIADAPHFNIERAKRLAYREIPDILDLIEREHIERFKRKGRLSDQEAGWARQAVELYLNDMANCGGTDSIPTYFCETFPSDYHERYLNDYKYIFDTTLGAARQKLLDFLRDNL